MIRTRETTILARLLEDSCRSHLMKRGFEFIALALPQVLDGLLFLRNFSPANSLAHQ
jgi:hypothetical protein